jgi:hypothetical protein
MEGVHLEQLFFVQLVFDLPCLCAVAVVVAVVAVADDVVEMLEVSNSQQPILLLR